MANRELATTLLGSGPAELPMRNKTLRDKVVHEARRDAAAFNRQISLPLALVGHEWVVKAWAAVRRTFRLTPRQAVDLWPVYWETICKETARITANRDHDE
jgi:hypothetical protein